MAESRPTADGFTLGAMPPCKVPKPCLHRNPDRTGCPEYALDGESYCWEHRRRSPSTSIAVTTRWRKLRRQLIDAAPRPWSCGLCGGVIEHDGDIEVDHRTPVAEGGAPYDPANLQLTHRGCNRRKRNRVERKPHPNAASHRPPWMNEPAA